ncbi:MAG: sulfite exporter TauE/SafE family protein [Elusimicrobia bacterium]|nr:sulfite exporter TauE/SafE family protein [Candidatus Liberimonas magnetica]
MTNELYALSITALSLGFFHTIAGPDHYIPFIAMAKARNWPVLKTIWITFICGAGHIMSSVVLGMIGVCLGLSVKKLQIIESLRGEIAAWALIGFGLLYFVWGLRQAYKNKTHAHSHLHEEGLLHEHKHSHIDGHTHVHEANYSKANITPWVLFTIFVLGPCEPLIPIVMYPAATGNVFGTVLVTVLFGGITVLLMIGIVLASSLGISFLPLKKIERYTHALAGGSILCCGLAIKFLGL